MRHPWQLKGDRRDRVFVAGSSVTPVLHLKRPQDSQEICCDTCSATRVAQQGVPRTLVQLCVKRGPSELKIDPIKIDL